MILDQVFERYSKEFQVCDTITEILEEEIELKRLIGKGSYGEVYEGMVRGKPVAVKILKAQFDEKTIEDFKHEVRVMSKVSHQNTGKLGIVLVSF